MTTTQYPHTAYTRTECPENGRRCECLDRLADDIAPESLSYEFNYAPTGVDDLFDVLDEALALVRAFGIHRGAA